MARSTYSAADLVWTNSFGWQKKSPENYVQGLKQIGGGSASGGERKETTAVTPAGSLDPKIAEALAGLGKEDRTMVDSQKYCAVMTNSLLGSMGTPQAWVSPNGVVHLVFGSGEEISHCSSSDNGKGFSKPTVAFRDPISYLMLRAWYQPCGDVAERYSWRQMTALKNN